MALSVNQIVQIEDLPLGRGDEYFIGRVAETRGGEVVIEHEWAELNLTPEQMRAQFKMTWRTDRGSRYCPVKIVSDKAGRLQCRLVFVEQRGDVRVRCDADLHFLLLSDEAVNHAAQEVMSQVTSIVDAESDADRLMRADEDEDAMHTEAVAIRRLLEKLTHQMDHLIDAVEGRAPKFDDDELQAAEVLDLSGSGMAFRHGADHAAGAFLRLRIDVHGMAGLPVEVVGQIIRVDTRTGEEFRPEHFNIGVRFTHIREIDRERIIHHIFKAQRNQLRNRAAKTA